MKPARVLIAMFVVSLFLAHTVLAQSPDSANQNAASAAPSASAAEVPRLIKFSGTLLDAQDRPMAGPVGVTFALYSQQTGGAALWLETQNVKPDASGVYTVLLGANSANGVPAELFASAEARWLEVQVERQAEQPRVLLVSVPYALKAKDAETLGGKPASAFVTTETLTGNSTGTVAPASRSSTASTALPSSSTQSTLKKAGSVPQAFTPCTSVTSDGAAAVNSIARFTAACNIESSVITQSGSNVGIGTATPAVALDVVGNNAGLRLSGTGTHQVTVTGTTSGRLGQDANGFFFASDTNGKTVRFLTNNGALNEWMRITSAGNVGIGTTTPAAKLDVAGNFNLPNTTSGGTAGVIQLGGLPFLHNFGSLNTFVGAAAGNTGLTGTNNTGVGSSALSFNGTGFQNSAFGSLALHSNSTGGDNSAFGASALTSNMTASNNTAVGFVALGLNNTGTNNTAVGASALHLNTTANDNTAVGSGALSASTGAENTAVGAGALESNTTGTNNTAVGAAALATNSTNSFNTAVGALALNNNTGFQNTAVGASALQANTTGSTNTALGTSALGSNTTAINNTAVGNAALFSVTTGTDNTAVGSGSLQKTTGNSNTAVGADALELDTTGSNNIAIGDFGGSNVTTGNNNIHIGNTGQSTDGGVIRIGAQALQHQTFIAGISGVTTGLAGATVLVDANGQLGTISSSRRFKYDIQDMGDRSGDLLRLRPVAFRYKQAQNDGSHPLQYGLIAEEVAEVYPEMVQRAPAGEVTTVLYHLLPAMLLNEVQKQQRTIRQQQAEIEDLTTRLVKLEALVAPVP